MKKFQSLEKLKESKLRDNGSNAVKDVTLTEKDMEKLFHETSAFNMDRVLNDDYYYSDDESIFSEDEGHDTVTKKRKRDKSNRVRGPSGKTIDYTVIPVGNLPRSWGKTIKQFVPNNAIHTKTTWKAGEITNFDVSASTEIPEQSHLIQTKNLSKQKIMNLIPSKSGGFQGIVLSPPWKYRLGSGDMGGGLIEPEDLLNMGLQNTKLLKAGFIYIWTPKHLVCRTMKVMNKLDFFYVENGIVVRQTTNNHLEHETSRKYVGEILKVGHELLLIFRKGFVKKSGKREWTKVEIRHQRTSDVGFAFYGKDSEYEYVNDYVYNLVETMVPLGRYNPGSETSKKGSGKLLHLWSHHSKQRSGWVHIVEN